MIRYSMWSPKTEIWLASIHLFYNTISDWKSWYNYERAVFELLARAANNSWKATESNSFLDLDKHWPSASIYKYFLCVDRFLPTSWAKYTAGHFLNRKINHNSYTKRTTISDKPSFDILSPSQIRKDTVNIVERRLLKCNIPTLDNGRGSVCRSYMLFSSQPHKRKQAYYVL